MSKEAELTVILKELMRLCDIHNSSSPFVAYSANKHKSIELLADIIEEAELRKKPIIAIVSWAAITSSQENLDRMVRFGLKSITHVLHFMNGKTCIIELVPEHQDNSYLLFFNPKL